MILIHLHSRLLRYMGGRLSNGDYRGAEYS